VGCTGSPVFDADARLMALYQAGGRPASVMGQPPIKKEQGMRISRVAADLAAAGASLTQFTTNRYEERQWTTCSTSSAHEGLLGSADRFGHLVHFVADLTSDLEAAVRGLRESPTSPVC
jgi:hypothetical protein